VQCKTSFNARGIRVTVKTTPTIDLSGKSGAKYTFRVYPWDARFKPLGGVYLALCQRPNLEYFFLCVGQLGNLKKRFNHYDQQACLDRHRMSHIAIWITKNEAMRFSVEADLLGAGQSQ